MSDFYNTGYIFLTSYIPQVLILLVFFPVLIVGVAIKFMKNPTNL